MSSELSGVWKFVAWRRIAQDGTISYPLGEGAHGQLIYTDGGHMAVQITAADRPALQTGDPLGGDSEERAGAYSTCLAYIGTYEVQGDTVVHTIDVSLYPNWAGVQQVRLFTYENGELILRTPPMNTESGTVVNELAWMREEA